MATTIPEAIPGLGVEGQNLYEQAECVLNHAMNRRTRAQWVPAAQAIAEALDRAGAPRSWKGKAVPSGRSVREAFGLWEERT